MIGRGPLGPSDVDPDDIRDLACDATAPSQVCNPPVREPDAPEPPDVPDLAGPSSGLGVIGQLLVVLLVAALVLAIVWLIMRWRADNVSESDDGDDLDDDGDRDQELDEEIGARIVDDENPPARWRRLAAEHRAAGRYRDAIRCEYRALVGDLARAGYVDEIPGRTSGEERDQVGLLAARLGEAGRSVAQQFDVAADTFDVAWFGDGAVTSVDDERFLAAQTTVLDAVLSGVRTGGGR